MKVWLLENDNRDQVKLQSSYSIDERKLETFLQNHSSGNIFQTVSMYKLYKCVKGYQPNYMAVVDEKGDIQGLMLSCIIAEQGVKTFFSSRSIITGGPIAKENDSRVIDILLENYLQQIRKKAIYSQCRNIYFGELHKEIFARRGFDYKDHYTIIIDLDKTVEDLFGAVHKKKRNNIRRAVKRGVSFRQLSDHEDIEKAIDLIQSTYKRIRLPGPPRSLLENAINFFPDNVYFFGAYYENEIIAAKISLGYKSMIYDWYSGHDLSYSYLCANDVIAWNCVLWAKKNHFDTYDMGGAGRPGVNYGVRNFKLRFGGILKNTGRFTQIHKSLLYMAGSSFINLRSKI